MESSADPGPSLVGRLLDERYRLDSVIARGGMATVYLAIDTRLDRIVAVKVMHRNLADDPSFVARFTREAKAAAKVAGPEVVAVHDQGTDPETGLAYLVMEHVRGQNLRQLLLTIGPLSPARAVAIMEPVLRALASAHAVGMVHRDVKPENVLVGDDQRVKVADFGLARAVEASDITQTHTHMMGSVAYLAPEQVETGTADARSDVYASGVLLWELLTGAPPHSGDTAISVAHKHVYEDVPPPSTAVAGIPPQLDDLVVRATRRKPEERPADAGVFLRELQAVKATLPAPQPISASTDTRTLVVPRVVPPVVKTPPKEPKEPRARRRGLVAAALILALGLLALGGGFLIGNLRYTKAPALVGDTETQARAELTKAGLKVKLAPTSFSESVAKGQVMKQDPGPGGRVKKDGTVTITLSKGPDRRAVPDLVGKTLAQATSALKRIGLSVSPNPAEVYSTRPKGQVVSSDPVKGTALKPDATVSLVLSKGPEPVTVPTDLAGKKVDEASRTLDQLGFKVTVTRVFSDQVPNDVVISYTPHSGTAGKGSTVSLTVSKGPDVVAVPDLKNLTPAEADQALRNAGLVPNRIDAPFSSGSRVYNQSPGKSKRVKRGSTVTYYVF